MAKKTNKTEEISDQKIENPEPIESGEKEENPAQETPKRENKVIQLDKNEGMVRSPAIYQLK